MVIIPKEFMEKSFEENFIEFINDNFEDEKSTAQYLMLLCKMYAKERRWKIAFGKY